MLQIKQAPVTAYADVRNFYYQLTDEMAASAFAPGWQKDVYPTQTFLLASLERGDLFYGMLNDAIAACMIINHEGNDGYIQGQWSIEATATEMFVIHALGVLPRYSGQGLAQKMTRYAIERARRHNLKTLRLDVLAGNLPAERAYLHVGFRYCGTARMFYEDTGWTSFKLFEFLL